MNAAKTTAWRKTIPWRRWLRIEYIVLAALAAYPLAPFVEDLLFRFTNISLGPQLSILFVFAVLALGLNVVVGQTGLLHLSIAAFFGLGAYITGVLRVGDYPFQVPFSVALVLSTAGAAAAGLVLGAPTLRLRGDYLAIVTLGFGEVVKFSLRNLEEITNGTRTLSNLPPPWLPAALGIDWNADYRAFYYLNFAVLVVVVVLLRNLENSRLGRAWMAVREDELAATCMGIDATRVKLSAFAVGAALAGMAGCLYATTLGNTAGPDAFDFNRSIIMLCCIILGGLGSLRGTLLGVAILLGFDNILAPFVDQMLQRYGANPSGNPLLSFSGWRLMVFGLALVLVMRFRPEGLLPSLRVQQELHEKPATV